MHHVPVVVPAAVGSETVHHGLEAASPRPMVQVEQTIEPAHVGGQRLQGPKATEGFIATRQIRGKGVVVGQEPVTVKKLVASVVFKVHGHPMLSGQASRVRVDD